MSWWTSLVAALVVSVVSFSDGHLQVDSGLDEGLLPGDRGVLFYQLSVSGRQFRFDVAPIELVRCGSAICTARSDQPVRPSPGYSVEFPSVVKLARLVERTRQLISVGEREAARKTLARARDVAAGQPNDLELLQTLAAQIDPPPAPVDTGWKTRFREAVDERDWRTAERLLAAQNGQPKPEMNSLRREVIDLKQTDLLFVPASEYPIGGSASSARFYNQTPQHRRPIDEYWIQKKPFSDGQSVLLGLSHHDAAVRCRSAGMRLPTEFEWETAARRAGFETRPAVSEWTSSWYLPYPGNNQPEPEYGERFKVIRGFDDDGQLQPTQRFLMLPGSSDRSIGFRCVQDVATGVLKP